MGENQRMTILSMLKTMEDLKKYSAKQLQTLTNDFEEKSVRIIMTSLAVGCESKDAGVIIGLQRQALAHLYDSWRERHQSEVPAYFEDYEILFESGMMIEALTAEELVELEDKVFTCRLTALMMKYIQENRGKDCTNRRLVRTFTQELLQLAGVQLGKEDQQTLDKSDDELLEKLEMVITDADREVTDLLTPIFFGIREEATNFLMQIKGAKPTQVMALVNKLIKERKISKITCGKAFWEILHNAHYYDPELRNWNKQIIC